MHVLMCSAFSGETRSNNARQRIDANIKSRHREWGMGDLTRTINVNLIGFSHDLAKLTLTNVVKA